jgi:hypothetical protein
MPDDRDWSESDYSRLYHSILSDPKFATVYPDDRAWALYTRLLMAADAAWPTPTSIPRSAPRAAIRVLVEAGVIELANDLVTITALAKERAHRYGKGKGRLRYPSDKPPDPEPIRSGVGAESESSGEESEVTRNHSEAPAGAQDSSSLSDSFSPSKTDRARDDEPEWPVLSYLASVKAFIRADGNGYHRELIALVERRGAVAVVTAMRARYAAGDRSARQLLYGAANALEPIASGKATPARKGHQVSDEEADRAFNRGA